MRSSSVGVHLSEEVSTVLEMPETTKKLLSQDLHFLGECAVLISTS